MPTWILIAIFGTIAVTAGLIAILQRVNRQGPRNGNAGGDSGQSYVDGGRRDVDSHESQDGGDAGGDGGGD